MITAKQAEARRRNGRLSRGPKTPEGKAIVSRNATKFGFFTPSTSGRFEGARETEKGAFFTEQTYRFRHLTAGQ